ncbi:MAG: sigma-54-dependent Fis family transcriptional regulator [Candidatus Zixiibacteriota bacterium]|nr:MAG: sigma-54-dependent Fis family transcriptional regulator [candidate division Zixibacteria bacterium]
MDSKSINILVIDDDPKVPWILSEGLGNGYSVDSVRDGKEGINKISQTPQSNRPELILLDIQMPGMNGIEVLEKLRGIDDKIDVIMLSGHGDTKNIVDSVKKGAAEFINKPFDVREVEIHIRSVLEKRRLKEELTELRKKLKESEKEVLIGDSPPMVEIKNIIEEVADSELTVLIRGESGTGKEIVARLIHLKSARNNAPFVKVNCAAIPRDLLEAELFGYEKGAFTGAHKTKPGRFEVANNGTMFLDEIGDMPMELQSKLLQVLEQQEFVRVGGINNIHVDVRIVCATNKNLDDAITEGLFRDDLFYRLNEITVNLPGLAGRRSDVPLLVDHFLDKYSILYKKERMELKSETIKQLQNFDWPGNVRQLENLIKQIVVRSDENIIYDTLKGPISGAGRKIPQVELSDGNFSMKKKVQETVSEVEKMMITQVLHKTNWNRRKAAKMLDISYRSLLYKIKEYKIID